MKRVYKGLILLICFAVVDFTRCADTETLGDAEDHDPVDGVERASSIRYGVTYPVLQRPHDMLAELEQISKLQEKQDSPGNALLELGGLRQADEEYSKMVEMGTNENRHGRSRRNVDTSRLWPAATIPYFISSDVSDSLRMKINEIMEYISNVSCVEFQEFNAATTPGIVGHDTKVVFQQDMSKSCSSYVGKSPELEQQFVVNEECDSLGELYPIFFFLMGFWREELRSDRDMYVTIHLENAIAGTSSAFSKKEGAGYSTFDIPYDYSSIVHSPSTAISVNGQPTITTLDPLDMPYLGQRVAPTFYDLKKLNAAYCQDTIETNCSSTNPCLYEGYQRGDCTCACKPGFTNSTCGDEIPNFESRCIHRYTIDDGRMGSISSPNYSSNYDPNVICQYIITGPVGSTMSVSFTDFILHLPGASCDTDYLQIFLTNTSYVADFTLCGTNTAEAFVSPSNVIRFVFFSDSADTGFSLMYAFNTSGVPREEVCNATLTESSGELSYSASGSTTSAYCTYDIIAPERQRIALTVDSIKVQNSFCCVNRMEIHLGDGNWNPIQFCDETVISKEIISADNKMQIVFALEENSSGSASFSVTYRTVEINAGPSDPGVSFGCERTVEENGGYIQSPRYPMTYPKMTCCEYEIIASPGLHVELTFQKRFLIEEEDTLTIAFGGSMLVRIVLTGNAAPKGSYISLSDRMRIKFESNKSWFYGIGFRAFFKSVSVDIPAVPSTTMESISSHSDPTGPIMK